MPRPKEHIVTLTAGDRVKLSGVVSRGTHPARMIARARILLELDEAADTVSDRRVVAERAGVSEGTVYLVAKRFAESGGRVEEVIGRLKRAAPPVPAKVTGDVEARVIALACTEPSGRVRPVVAAAAGEARTAHRRDAAAGPLHDGAGPEKGGLRPHLKKCWTIPPHASGEFVARMEDVLEVYHRPYDPAVPVVCMDEALPVARPRPRHDPGRNRKEDSEYVRRRTCSIFVWIEPFAGRRRGHASPRRTCVNRLGCPDRPVGVDRRPPPGRRVVLVMDNRNTHTLDSLNNEAFEPAKARALAGRLELHYTPKHGSWLIIAEIELSRLTRQCVDRRIDDLDLLNTELAAWQAATNDDQRQVDWQFTGKDARITPAPIPTPSGAPLYSPAHIRSPYGLPVNSVAFRLGRYCSGMGVGVEVAGGPGRPVRLAVSASDSRHQYHEVMIR